MRAGVGSKTPHTKGPGGRQPVSSATPALGRLVFVVVANPVLGVVWILVAPFGGEVEEVVGRIQEIDAPCVRRVGMVDIALAVLVKRADALAFIDVHFKRRVIVELLSAPNLFGSKRNVEIDIEVGLIRGNPRESPAHPFLKGLDLL